MLRLFCSIIHISPCPFLAQDGWLRLLPHEAGMGLPHSSGRLYTVTVDMLCPVTYHPGLYALASSHPPSACSSTGLGWCLAHRLVSEQPREYMVRSRQH